MASGKIKTLRTAILAVLGSAAGSGLLAADAAARVLSPRDEDEVGAPLLLAPPQFDASELLAHSSHRSHQSHRSHSSGHGSHYSAPSYSPSYSGSSSSSGSHSGSSGSTSWKPRKPAPPPKPAKVSLVALPGGSIFVDGKRVGRDETKVLTLKAGTYRIKVENRFLGDHERELTLSAGQSGTVKIEW